MLLLSFLALVREMSIVSAEGALLASVLIYDEDGCAFEVDDVRYLTTVLECKREV